MAVKLYVGGLAYACGTVEPATVITDRYSGQSRGFDFVEMGTDEEAQKAISTLSGQCLDGRPIKVEVASPQGPGGGGRGGGRPRSPRW